MQKEFKAKYKLELQEELWRLEFATAHDSEYIPELEKLITERKAEEEVKRQAFVDASEKASHSKKKEDRLEQKKSAQEYQSAQKRTENALNTLDQITTKVNMAKSKIDGIKHKIEFLKSFDGEIYE